MMTAILGMDLHRNEIVVKTLSNGVFVVELESPTSFDIQAAWKALSERAGQTIEGIKYPSNPRYTVSFNQPTRVRHDSRTVNEYTSMDVRFFVGRRGTFAYTFFSRSGYAVSDFSVRNVVSIALAPEIYVPTTEKVKNFCAGFIRTLGMSTSCKTLLKKRFSISPNSG